MSWLDYFSDELRKGKTTMQSYVSGHKNRYQDGCFDLDLTYITDRIIAMGVPSEGLESFWRNHLDDVCYFLETRHTGHYLIFNVSDRVGAYNEDKLRNVIQLGWPDHHAPLLPTLLEALAILDAWLSSDAANVVAVHCQAGKGRTGTVIAAYLLFSAHCATAGQALRAFAQARSKTAQGVTVPSQRRTVCALERLIAVYPRLLAAEGRAPTDSVFCRAPRVAEGDAEGAGAGPPRVVAVSDGRVGGTADDRNHDRDHDHVMGARRGRTKDRGEAPDASRAARMALFQRLTLRFLALAPTVRLRKAVMRPALAAEDAPMLMYFKLHEGDFEQAKWRGAPQAAYREGTVLDACAELSFEPPVELQGDVLVKVYQRSALFGNQKLFRMQFHTMMIGEQGCMDFDKGELDSPSSGALKDPKIPESFSIRFLFF